jgi:integrase
VVTTSQTPELGDLLSRYLKFAALHDDGCLTTDKHQEDGQRRASYLTTHFGAHRPVGEITVTAWREYAQKRRDGAINGRRVRTRSIRGDLLILLAAIRWAMAGSENGKPELVSHPLAVLKLPTERDPRRPTIARTTIDRLIEVAPVVEPRNFPLLLKTAYRTGRRISSILGLCRYDIDFVADYIKWRAEIDKRRKTWRTGLPKQLKPALQAHVETMPEDGVFVFAHPADPTRPLSKDDADTLLERAYRVGNIPRTGGLWHPFRRYWAMVRKGLPLSDLAAAGGWDCIRTLTDCYQLADPETTRAVVDYGD